MVFQKQPFIGGGELSIEGVEQGEGAENHKGHRVAETWGAGRSHRSVVGTFCIRRSNQRDGPVPRKPLNTRFLKLIIQDDFIDYYNILNLCI